MSAAQEVSLLQEKLRDYEEKVNLYENLQSDSFALGLYGENRELRRLVSQLEAKVVDLNERLDAMENAKSATDMDLAQAKKDHAQVKKLAESLLRQVHDLKQENGELKSRLQTVEAANQSLKSRLETVEAANQSMKSRLKTVKQSMKSRLKTVEAANQSMKSRLKTVEAANQSMKAANQSMKAANQSMKAANQSMKSQLATFEAKIENQAMEITRILKGFREHRELVRLVRMCAAQDAALLPILKKLNRAAAVPESKFSTAGEMLYAARRDGPVAEELFKMGFERQDVTDMLKDRSARNEDIFEPSWQQMLETLHASPVPYAHKLVALLERSRL